MKKYVAFLRGINVGGHQVKMAELKKELELLGYKNVKTLIASGNVYFESKETDEQKLTKKLEQQLEKKWGFAIPVVLRTIEQLENLVKLDPFKNISVDKNTRLYITFLKEKSGSKMKTYEFPGKQFNILNVTSGEIFSVLQLDGNGRTVDLMNIIEKEFGKAVTTRNWNTIAKAAQLHL